VGKRNRKKRRQRRNQHKGWAWPQSVKEQLQHQIDRHKRKKEKKKRKITWVEDPSIPEKLQIIWNSGKIVIGRRSKDGSVEFYQVSANN